MKMRLLVFVGICVYVVALLFFPMDTVRLWIDQLLQVFLIGWFPLIIIVTIVFAVLAMRGSVVYLEDIDGKE